MNPWWPLFLEQMGAEHDEKCVSGPRCAERDEHIRRDYIPDRLRRIIDHYPEAQADAISGRPV